MKMVYVSHPFTGNEEKNREEARKITSRFAYNYPDIVFINPLDAMCAQEEAGLDYEDILSQTVELMNRCDIVMMTGNWGKSAGCQVELQVAVEKRKYICTDENLDKVVCGIDFEEV